MCFPSVFGLARYDAGREGTPVLRQLLDMRNYIVRARPTHASLRDVNMHMVAIPRAAPLRDLEPLDEHTAPLDLYIVPEPHGVACESEVRQLDAARLLHLTLHQIVQQRRDVPVRTVLNCKHMPST